MNNSADFKRPDGIPNGVLLNTNNDSLQNYKKAKKKFASVNSLEKQVKFLMEQVQQIQKVLDDRNINTN